MLRRHELAFGTAIFVVVFLTLCNIHFSTIADDSPSYNEGLEPSSSSNLQNTETKESTTTKPLPSSFSSTHPFDERPTIEVQVEDSIYKGKPRCIECAPIVIEKFKLLFFTNAKVGCTVWKQLCRRIMGFENWLEVTEGSAAIPHDPKFNGLKYLYHYDRKEATYMMTSPDWTRAVFVRDPKERLLSAFLDKGKPNRGRKIKAMCCTPSNTECKQLVRKAAESFSGFINLTQWCKDPHWSLQADRMEPKYWPFIDFVGHLESAAKDAEVLLRKLGAWDEYGANGWGQKGTNSIFDANLSPHTTGSNNRLLDYYTPELERLVDFDLYAKDYEHIVLDLKIKTIDWSALESNNSVDALGTVAHILPNETWNNISTALDSNSTIIPENDTIYKGATQCWDCSPIVVEGHNLIFFTIAKVGCTIFKQLFRRIMGHDDYRKDDPGGVPHNPAINGLVYLYHYTPEKAYDILTSPNWTRAMFVRDPKERLLSAYLDKGVRARGKFVKEKCCYQDNAPEHCRTEINKQIKSLEGFAEIIHWCPNPHWASQSSRVADNYWNYITFVGHLETAADDTKKLLTRLGLWELYGSSGWGESGKDPIFTNNQARHQTGAKDLLLTHFTPELERKVEMLFASDYSHPILNLTLTVLSNS